MNDKRIVHDFDQLPRRSPHPRGRRWSPLQRTRPERRAFHAALGVSVLVHVLLLSQLVGGEGRGLPGLVLPWQARRAVVPDVHMVLVPAPNPPASPAPPPQDPVVVEVPAPRLVVPAEAERSTVAEAVPLRVPPRADAPDRAPPPLPPPPPLPRPEPVAVTAQPVESPTSVVPAVPVAPTAVIAVDPSASSPDPVALAQQEAAVEAQRQATARAEAARLEAERQETARQAAAQLEVQRQEAARQATARAETARLETERQEAARKAAAQQQQQQEAARAQAAQDAVAKREALLRAIGRQLDEENARRDAAVSAARSSSTLPRSLSTARRARLWGHTDTNAELVAYAQAWALKIQLNTLPDKVRDVARRPHTPPTVTVALRSDGSVESVTFVVSSGVPEVDEAIRSILDTQRPYPAFPPALAREFDVVEIRRSWYFDAAVRLH